MELKLHSSHHNAIEQALIKAKQYRLLLEPEIAESICLDILSIDDNNQNALLIYILALLDQVQHSDKPSQIKASQQAISKLSSQYHRDYYLGLLNEKQARYLITQPMSRNFAYDYFIAALTLYQQAEQHRPDNNDEAVLRRNSCIRTIQKENLQPRADSDEHLVDMES